MEMYILASGLSVLVVIAGIALGLFHRTREEGLAPQAHPQTGYVPDDARGIGATSSELPGTGTLRSRPSPMPEVAAQHSAEEQIRFREEFAPIAHQCRQVGRRLEVCLYAFILWMTVGAFCALLVLFQVVPASILPIGLPDREDTRGAMRLAVYVWSVPWLLLMLVLGLPLFRVQCPACHNRLYSVRLGHYCPACGRRRVEAGNWLRAPRCGACGSHVGPAKRRRYKIRACTHCGVILDEAGF